jgi:hypothetical protein
MFAACELCMCVQCVSTVNIPFEVEIVINALCKSTFIHSLTTVVWSRQSRHSEVMTSTQGYRWRGVAPNFSALTHSGNGKLTTFRPTSSILYTLIDFEKRDPIKQNTNKSKQCLI